MSNQERAADLIANATIPLGALAARGMDRAILAAQTLADAGLLMPDLPEPEEVEEGNPYWYSGTCGISVGRLARGGRRDVLFWDSEPGGVTYDSVEGARELAYALLAAAKLAEEQE